MARTGRIKWFDDSQGFGFIEDDGGDIFVHRSEVSGTHAPLTTGDLVEFELRGGPRGRAACHVRLSQAEAVPDESLSATTATAG